MMAHVLQISCITKHYYPETVENIKKLCTFTNTEFKTQDNATCCGMPYFEKGELKSAKAIGEFNLKLYSEDKVICASSKCYHTVKEQYPRIFNNTVSHNQAVNLSKTCTGLQTLIQKIPKKYLESIEGRFFYVKDCCSTLQNSTLFDMMPQAVWSTSALAVNCCGAGTSMPAADYNAAADLSLQLIHEFQKGNYDLMVFEDDVCRKQIDNIALQSNLPIETSNLVDLLMKNIP